MASLLFAIYPSATAAPQPAPAAARRGRRPPRRGAAGARRGGIRWRLDVCQGVEKFVHVLELIICIVHFLIMCFWAVAPAPLGWLEVLVPRFSREEIRTILESCNVNQPLEVGNELRADEELVSTRNPLLENVLERAAHRGNQSAHVD